ncbi:MAG: phosphoglycolate phosphatase [Candidatus Methanoperedens nitroreducens]|uniref:Phosphoglycolate phosphatase n=1 Tax=Candidatus Methanoperedens nitratireducens TaxID=1392998 RepID=A0A0P8ACJ2_9EURY|nr:phosphoglycolate phosphatase [Candidatus Methanoperedens sp. BLZ2]KAB2944227.1 MAG: phosphoglycolate phosphatase [Candidatus Methanoperedens sp.]KPQ44491.1 MAG: phosphoglycolate phosphatase [Candidatus Methanoperedens sp. BLZ1]MBZ0174641.1 phosphoglycolate phosphatase [Candidatus Methanoperedens nitroreducens]MCX9076901.1 phosphoglycolate phosphatase [Candidatus Methanoperedens sp.]
MVFKAVVVDVDGTITYSDRSIDCKAVAALRSLHVPVVIATGNVLCVVRAVAKLLGTSGIVMAENGGVVECGKVESDTSHIKECREALEILKQHFSHLEMLDLENRITEIGLRRNFDAKEARKFLGEDAPVDIVDTGFAIHIKSKKINKGTGLRRIAEMMGLDARDFVAIGDSPNDIEMLEAAGFGVAVGNAHPDLKRVAKMVTKGEHGTGVEEAVRDMKRRGEIR